jgi:hypothetical protein
VIDSSLYTINAVQNPDGSMHVTGSSQSIPGSYFAPDNGSTVNIDLVLGGPAYGTIDVGEVIAVTAAVNATATGGDVFFNSLNCKVFGTEDPSYSALQLINDNSQEFSSGQFLSTFYSDPASYAEALDPIGGYWNVDLQIQWSGFLPTDTLSLDIPSNSLDVSISSVPEPTFFSALILPATLLLSRRWRPTLTISL